MTDPIDTEHARRNAHRCCWCPEFCAPGDRIACVAHRRRLDETPMPWEGEL